ncbi:HAD family phosphatase [Salipiger sp. IMCC34102]|uniref:HAD family hydrolase n=1 Tax=Salipiger sp. IMCC34102 TaxID=2510647 RepID=UPI00101CA25D|nr:HAD family phosphatase [Salipiger sp. IMCC34102]RYH01981.1 HAD family phosphatase [Salipiger sp. IMCC34102]
MPIDAVIFDIGNVLLEWRPERFYDARIGVERRRALFDAVDLHGMNEGVDRGADFRTSVETLARAHPEFQDEIMMWHDNWLDMASPAIPHSVRLLRALRGQGVPVFALSNFGIKTFAVAEETYPFLVEFDRRYISGHMGFIKPEAEIYRRVETDCATDSARLLFIDDRADNIAAAKARGWQVHHFDGPQGLADLLVAEGLLTREQAE